MPDKELLDVPENKRPEGEAIPDCEGVVTTLPDPANSQVPPPPEGKKRILIAIPMLSVTFEFFESFLKFWTELVNARDPRYELGYHFVYRKPVHMAEEIIVNVAQNNKCTHILFMDDDIYDITKADLDKLVEADKDVIAGIMHASKFPHAMCAFRRYDPDKKVTDMPTDKTMYRLYEVPCTCPKCNVGLSHWDIKHCPNCGEEQHQLIQKVDLIPFCFTLMNIKIFDKIKQPWFYCSNTYPSDSWFSDRVEEAGYQEYAHMGVRLNHAGVNDATKPFYVQMGMEKARRDKAVVELTPEQMDAHQTLLMDKMKETEDKQRPEPVFAGGQPPKEAKPSMTLKTHGL